MTEHPDLSPRRVLLLALLAAAGCVPEQLPEGALDPEPAAGLAPLRAPSSFDAADDAAATEDGNTLPEEASPRIFVDRGGGKGFLAPYTVEDGQVVLGGDVILGEYAELARTPPPPGAGLTTDSSLWTACRVPYELGSSVDAEMELRIRSAIADWEDNTDFVFTEDASASDRLVFEFVSTDAGTCRAHGLGMIGGELLIELEDGCSAGNTVHEIGHAMGLYHEQSRADRDSYVQVLWDNIDPDYTSQFERYDDRGWSGSDYADYDHGSVMHYPSGAFSTGSTCNSSDTSDCTLVHTDGSYISEYQRTGLSDNDVDSIAEMYADQGCGCDVTVYDDGDGDGYGDPGTAVSRCDAPSSYTEVTNGDDCDDGDARVHPGASERCNEVDDDCDDAVDEGVTSTYYRDADGDDYGLSSSTTQACSEPSGYATVGGDCDDGDPAISPAETEVCNGVDDNCSGEIDEGVIVTFYEDADNDGWGDSATAVESCTGEAEAVTRGGDCDDGAAEVHPGADETCNDRDDDCDTEVDEGLDRTWYGDADGDGFGVEEDSLVQCAEPAGYSERADDCDDADDTVHPGAPEVCNDGDDDCDGEADEGLEQVPWYEDGDGDGWGDPAVSVVDCAPPSGYIERGEDCDDGATEVHPDADELCNERDDDCDTEVDEDLAVAWYADADGDGFGDPETRVDDCAQPEGTVPRAGDCDDTDAQTHPGATEVPNGEDSNCDGVPTGKLVRRDGCGCTSGGEGAAGWALAAGLVALGLRRRGGHRGA